MEKTTFAKLPAVEKEQLKLLDAVSQVRAGKYTEAQKAFRSVTRSEDLNVSVYAMACAEVLKKFENGQFEGKPLSDRAAFADAGATLSRASLKEARDALKDIARIEGDNKGDHTKIVNGIKNNENMVELAGVFLGTEPEDLVLRLWKNGFTASLREIGRIDQKLQEMQAERRGGGRGNRAGPNREATELNAQREKVIETARDFILKRFDYGFFVEDPDIEELRAAQGDEDT
jgi:hypothetical protein